MEQAHDLIRSVARAFYPPEQTLIIDALVLHSAVRDDDLAHLMCMQVKYARKLCGRLREDGMLSVHSRAETKEGSNRPFSRDYFFIDTHKTIDVIKYRLARMTRDVDAKYGQTEDEKKEYFCPQCKSEYTQMEVLDVVDFITGRFNCRKCSHALEQVSDEYGAGHTGHEVQSRLNAQLSLFEKLLRTIDETSIPDNTFEEAMKNALPIKRDLLINPVAKSEPVAIGNLPPATVRGLDTEPEKVQVQMWDEKQKAEAAEAEAERRRRVAQQNVLPQWHLNPTVPGEAPTDSTEPTTNGSNGVKSEAEPDKKDLKLAREDEDEKKTAGTFDAQAVDDFYNQLENDEDDDNSSEEESSEAEEDDEDEVERANVEESTISNDGPPAKRVKLDVSNEATDGVTNAAIANGDDHGDSEEESEG
ncbi:MAG: hypothetical protein M1828_004116 [Chrysothrix sp. TS-e1954]|nr:MAG: hypothetical protein M1828_004116 [Chrysothrix sp. TS-e1954]